MAISEVLICNLALGHVSAGASIESLDEDSPEAVSCKQFFETARNHTLRDFDWKFASTRKALAALSNPPSGWLFKYEYPSNCEAAREILRPSASADPVPFDVALDDDLSRRVILSNQDQAWLRYTARVANPNLFDSQFVIAFSWRLAMDLVEPINASEKVRERVARGYLVAKAQAESANANEAMAGAPRDADWIRARG